MMSHEFTDMPGKSMDDMLMRCKWCMKTPTKAREDGCAIRELETNGSVLLADYNPDGVDYFKGRLCVTCGREIMGHELRRGSGEYWCHANQNQFSDGVLGCTVDIPEGFGSKTN